MKRKSVFTGDVLPENKKEKNMEKDIVMDSLMDSFVCIIFIFHCLILKRE